MEKKTVSRKVPIILAIAWLVASMVIVMYTVPKMIHLEGVFADWDVQMLVYLAELVFSVGVMIAIRILSVKGRIKWLAIISKILLIVYSVTGGIVLIAWIVLSLVVV